MVVNQANFLPVYQQQLKTMIIQQVDKEGPARERPLEGLKVVVNAGNGMGGFLVDTLGQVRDMGTWSRQRFSPLAGDTVHVYCFYCEACVRNA